jgi:hypothetical protein
MDKKGHRAGNADIKMGKIDRQKRTLKQPIEHKRTQKGHKDGPNGHKMVKTDTKWTQQ